MPEQDVQNQNIQEGAVSEGAASQEATTEQAAQEPAVTPEIAELISRKVTEGVEDARRKLQSTKDKEIADRDRLIAELRRSMDMQAGQSSLANQRLRMKVAEVDPGMAKDMELEELRTRDRMRVEDESRRTRTLQQIVAMDNSFWEDMKGDLQDRGIDPSDPRIDWGVDIPNLPNGFPDYPGRKQRIKASVKAIKGNAVQEISKLQAKIAEMEKRLGINAVDTTGSVGVSSNSDIAFEEALRRGDKKKAEEILNRRLKE